MTSTPETHRRQPAAAGVATFDGDQALVSPAGDVTAVVRDADIALVSVHGSPTDGGELARAVLHVLAAHAVPTDLVSVCADTVRLTVPRTDVSSIPGFLELVLSASNAELTVDEDVAKVSRYEDDFDRENILSTCYDILGIGLGPANLALAIALDECLPTARPHFLEARPTPSWQDGMLLSGSNIQNHPVRDLATLRNPRSRYTFINYLFQEGRLLAHLNLPVEFPLRKDYAQYVSWVANQFGHVTEFGAKITDVRVEQLHGQPVYVVTTADGDRRMGHALVVASGRTPYVPAPFEKALGSRVFHLTEYLYRIAELPAPPQRVAVIGGSQSAVELTLDLAKRFPESEVVNYVRSFGLKLKDTSPFSEEGYFPEFTSYYYRANRATKKRLDAYMRPTNYSSADADVLDELYLLLYEQKLDGRELVQVKGNRQVAELEQRGPRLHLKIQEVNTGEIEQAEFDCIVLATGFRDLGPGEQQEPYPALLAGVIDRFEFDDAGYLVVNEDYSLKSTTLDTPPLFLNGLCESSHGIGDAGSFSLLAPRAMTILRGYLARAHRMPDGWVTPGPPPSVAATRRLEETRA